MCHEIQKSGNVATIMLNNALSKYIFLASRWTYFLWIDIGHEILMLEVHNIIGSKSCVVCKKTMGGTENEVEAIEELRSSGLLLLALYLHPMQVVKIRELVKRG